jgi:type II secretory ATPase GspE/PulE/Tfp pilus assembly ATPase PilB-like protein
MIQQPSIVSVGGEPEPFAALLRRAATRDPQFATDFVSTVLRLARDAGASDVHVDPAADALHLRWRLDGVLQPMVQLPKEVGANVIARLKVLSGLLTYETALPQEGRIWDDSLRVEVRVSTFPTLYGERSVLRLLGATRQTLDSLSELGLPVGVFDELKRNLAATSGAVLIVGPAGSGKTTTAYACLRHLVAGTGGGRSIASLEDPIEVAVEGVAQTQVNLAADFDMATGLRSLLRLDPEVIFIGEMRDRATAEIALQAALTGQLVVTTFHAGDCTDAVNRLIDIGIPAYAVRNAVRLVVAQRLLRKLCTCAQPASAEQAAHPMGLDVRQCWTAGACGECHHTGYRGRTLVAEWRAMDSSDPAPRPSDNRGMWRSAAALIEAGTTSPMEVIRVLGLPLVP